ncbi:hypothetical protein, partial [Klebsiella michiganensis]|uniref:hypothetical protein n=1 Tax=Klebsiella michiganensis TaxID=1134687 RepID=UPI0013D731EB
VDMTKGMAIGRVTRSNEWTGKSRLIIATYPKDDFGQASIWPKPMAAEPYRQTLLMGLCAVRAMQLI